MKSCTRNSRRHNKSHGPLKAYYFPTSTPRPMLSTNKENENPINLPKTYWTDSEDALSVMSSFSDGSSPSSTTSLPRVTCALTMKKAPRTSDKNLQHHFSTIAGVKRNSVHMQPKGSDSEKIECACCSPSIPTKRPLVAMGTGGLRALRGLPINCSPSMAASSTSSSQNLAPICPIPMLPSYLGLPNMLAHPSPILRSTETQTTPPEDERRKTRRSRSRRSSGAILTSIKRKIDNIRRSVSADRLNIHTFFHDTSSPANPRRKKTEVLPATKCTLLQRFFDGSRLIQMRRRSPSDQFGIFVKVDSRGLYVNRMGNVEFTANSRNCLRAGDRVVEVQNIPTKGLDTEAVRGLLQGCQIALLKVKSTSR